MRIKEKNRIRKTTPSSKVTEEINNLRIEYKINIVKCICNTRKMKEGMCINVCVVTHNPNQIKHNTNILAKSARRSIEEECLGRHTLHVLVVFAKTPHVVL